MMVFERLVVWLAGLRRSHHSAEAMSWEAWRRIQRKNWSGARFFAQVAIASDPSWPDAYRMLGYAHRGAQDPARARSALRQGLAVAPNDFSLLVDFADMERSQGEFADAEALYRRALISRPDDVSALWKLSRALEGQARLDEAEQLLQRAWELAPSDVNVIKALSQVLTEQGSYREALPLLADVVEREPENAFEHYYNGIALAATGNREEARSAAEKAVALDPQTSRYQDLLARIEGRT
jgi:tetratricopeptide (TPR) repeat protein